MAPSSLKKMSGVQQRIEGNYASLEKKPLGKFINHDLGLTLLPGSQSQKKDEKRSGTAAESSPQQSGCNYAKTSEQWTLFECEIQSKRPAQETAFPTQATSSSSSPDLDPDSANFSHVTSSINRERLLSRGITAKNSNGVVHHNVRSLAAAPYVEQTMVTGEVSNAGSCQDDSCSPRAAKRRKSGDRASYHIHDPNVSKDNEATLEIPNNPSHLYHEQRLSEVDVVCSGKGVLSVETSRDSYTGKGGGLGSSKPTSRRRTTHSPDTAPARSHQDTNVGSESTALRDNSSILATSTSRSPANDQKSEEERLTEHYQPSLFSKSITQHSRLSPVIPADIGTQVLKSRKEVNRSWAPLFPANANAEAKKTHRAIRPAPSLLAVSFTPSDDSQHPYSINSQLTNTHLQATYISNAHPSLSLLTTHSHSKAFNYPFDYSSRQGIFQTERATNQPHSLRRRSASLPNLSFTSARPKMHFSNSVGPASMPTPPREAPSSLDQVDAPCNADISYPQNWHYNSNAQYHHRINLSDLHNTGFIPGPHPHQMLPQTFNHQHVTGGPLPKAGALAAGGQQYSRPWLEVKASYSLEEVKLLVSNLVKQSKILEAENSSLQSANAAMQKGCENLRHSNADLLQQIQRYERTSTRKDQLIAYMRQHGSSLNQQYKQNLEEHRRLLTRLRKEDGTGNPSAIAQTIRRNHSPSALSQGNLPRASAYPLQCANGAQIPAPSHGLGQTPTGLQEYERTSAPSDHNDSLHTHRVPTNRVEIDLTDDSRSPSYSASWVYQMPLSSIQGACPPSDIPLGQYSQAQKPAGHFETSQHPSGFSAGGEDLEAMQIQKENFARMAGKSLSWLKGENPFRKRAELPVPGQPPQSSVEEHVLSAQSPEVGRVAPLPETATRRRTTKKQAPKKTKVVLDAEAKKERAKIYRKTAAEKKKREKELAKQALPEEDTPSNDMRAQKQDRRAAKGEKRREHARKPSEEVGSWEPQRTLDGRLYQEDTGLQQIVHGGSTDQDRDSLFDESEGDDNDIAMHDDATAEEQARAKFAAEIEADLVREADAEVDVDAGTITGFEQGEASGGQFYFPATTVADDDHGFHDFSD